MDGDSDIHCFPGSGWRNSDRYEQRLANQGWIGLGKRLSRGGVYEYIATTRGRRKCTGIGKVSSLTPVECRQNFQGFYHPLL